MSCRCFNETFFLLISIKEVEIIITPKLPNINKHCKRIIPATLNVSPKFMVANPVTLTVLTAVKIKSIKEISTPGSLKTGNAKRMLATITTIK